MKKIKIIQLITVLILFSLSSVFAQQFIMLKGEYPNSKGIVGYNVISDKYQTPISGHEISPTNNSFYYLSTLDKVMGDAVGGLFAYDLSGFTNFKTALETYGFSLQDVDFVFSDLNLGKDEIDVDYVIAENVEDRFYRGGKFDIRLKGVVLVSGNFDLNMNITYNDFAKPTLDGISMWSNTFYPYFNAINGDEKIRAIANALLEDIGTFGLKFSTSLAARNENYYKEFEDKIIGPFDIVESKLLLVEQTKYCPLDPSIGVSQLDARYFEFSDKQEPNTEFTALWDFGDNTFSENYTDKHLYEKDGIYTVCLTQFDKKNDCEVKVCKEIIVGTGNYCNPKFSYTYDIETGEIDFTNINPSFSGAYYWTFGDGYKSESKDYVSHKYEKPGEYEVCLVVNDVELQCEDRYCDVVVSGENVCTVDFAFVANSNLIVDFSPAYSMNQITDGYWNFGDGNYSNDIKPSHQYKESGVYNVCVNFADEVSGCKVEKCKEVVVGKTEEVCLMSFNYYIDIDGQVNFVSEASSNIDGYYWEFGDGATSKLAKPLHKYEKSGAYKVCCVAYDNDSKCEIQVCNEVIVGDITTVCNADFSFYIKENSVEFTDKSIGAVSDWYWEISDGNSYSVQNPTHLFKTSGVYKVCLTTKDAASGCMSENCQEIQIGSLEQNCNANFVFTVDGLSATFSSNSLGVSSEGYWNISDGVRYNGDKISHTFKEAGIYDVCLSVVDKEKDCQSSECKRVQVGELTQICKADFSHFVKGKTVTFANKSLGTLAETIWYFGDGTKSDVANPEHTYASGGVYKVCLAIYDKTINRFSEVCKEIVVDVAEECKANFSFYVTSDDTVKFKNSSIGDLSKYYWSFGDGEYSKLENPKHKFKEAGVYKVCLMVAGEAQGCYSEYCSEVEIGAVTEFCEARFEHFVKSTGEVIFKDVSFGAINEWYWKFGDGKTSSRQSPIHTYASSGVYVVTLAVFDKETECTDVYETKIEVGALECKADFETFVDVDNLKVQFKSKSLGNIANYYWDFGDLNYSFEANPTHEYKTAGVYEVCLTSGKTDTKCFDKVCKAVQIGDVSCNADFISFVDSLNNVAYFKNEDLGSSVRLYWEFGDGSYSTESNPKHEYSQPGYYKVSLSTYNKSTGCMDYSSKVLLIGSQGADCNADFVFHVDWSTNKVFFSNKSEAKTITKYYWDFGDGIVSNEAEPVYEYSGSGYYKVCLTIVDETNSCKDFVCKEIQLGELTNECKSKFIYSLDSTTSSREVAFKDMSIGNPDIWEWHFGDDSKSDIQNPSHTYTKDGYYDVVLVIANSTTGCEEKYIDVINISGGVGLKASFEYTVIDPYIALKGSGVEVDFLGASFGDPSAFEWDFGDGTTNNTTLNPTHEYTEPGVYEVCFTIVDEITLQEDTYCQMVDIVLSSVNEIENNTSFDIYPNPAKDVINITYSNIDASDAVISIYDVIGNLVQEVVLEGNQIVLTNNLDNGIYIVTLTSGNTIVTKRLEVAK